MCEHGIIDGRTDSWVCKVCGEGISGFVADAYHIDGDIDHFMAYLKDERIDKLVELGIETPTQIE